MKAEKIGHPEEGGPKKSTGIKFSVRSPRNGLRDCGSTVVEELTDKDFRQYPECRNCRKSLGTREPAAAMASFKDSALGYVYCAEFPICGDCLGRYRTEGWPALARGADRLRAATIEILPSASGGPVPRALAYVMQVIKIPSARADVFLAGALRGDFRADELAFDARARAHCKNCYAAFGAARKVAAIVHSVHPLNPPFGDQHSLFLLCRPCHHHVEAKGAAGIPMALLTIGLEIIEALTRQTQGAAT